HRNARGARSPGNQPVHIDDRELDEERTLPQVDQSKSAADGALQTERTLARRKTAPLDRALGQQNVGVDLVGRDWRRADEEDGVEAHLTAHRDGHADIGELPAARDEATIEALNLAVPDLQVRSEEHTSELQSRVDLVC